jgi:hypothetical protein
VRKPGAGATDLARKKGKKEKNVDMEKLADGLQKLGEDDLLHVVQLVHDYKTPETYTKNDVESELHPWSSSPVWLVVTEASDGCGKSAEIEVCG